MSAHKKFLVAFLIAPAIFLFSSKLSFAQVVINEFAAVTEGTTADPDWVELYNNGDEVVDLNGWFLEDLTKNKKTLDGYICGKKFRKFDFSNRLDKGGDTIELFDSLNNSKNKVEYFTETVPEHIAKQSTGRVPNGAETWVVFTNPSPTNDDCFLSTPTPTSTLALTPTQTSSPKATFKINEAKDRQGNVLSSVKIYVDGVYIHHYVPETINFCGGCKCDTDVDCGFGEHAIELQKTGYEDWEEGINFTAGGSFETNPVMEATLGDSTTTPTPTPTPTPKPQTPTPTKKMTPTPEVTGLVATESGEVLGENEPTPTPTPLAVSTTGFSKSQLLPKILIIFGLVILFGVAFSLWYTKLR